ncbi:MAG: LysR family transcriptional regulator [Clostridium sp.]
MDTLQLKYFQTVAKYENISKAALELNISQPALSITIKRLEDEVGYPLFKRLKRNICLNKFGREFLEWANITLSELESLQSKFKEMHEITNKNFSIGSTGSLFLIDLLKKFLEKTSDLKITQRISNIAQLTEDLKYGNIDVAITSPTISANNIKTITLLEEEILLVVSRDNKLASKSSVYLRELKNENFVELTDNHSFSEVIKDVCISANFKPNVIFHGDINILKELVISNTGVFLTPLSTWKTFESPNLKAIHIKNKHNTRSLGLSYLDSNYKSETLKDFIAFSKEHFQSYKI